MFSFVFGTLSEKQYTSNNSLQFVNACWSILFMLLPMIISLMALQPEFVAHIDNQ